MSAPVPVADCTAVTATRGKYVHAARNEESRTLCGRIWDGWTVSPGAMPDCPRCLRKMTIR